LSRFVVLFGSFAKPFYCLRMILFDPLTALIANAEITLRVGIAFLGGLVHLFNVLPRVSCNFCHSSSEPVCMFLRVARGR